MKKKAYVQKWHVLMNGDLAKGALLQLTPTPQPEHPRFPAVGHEFDFAHPVNSWLKGVVTAVAGRTVTIDIADRDPIVIVPADPSKPGYRVEKMGDMETFPWEVI
ncbi:hypothetical protein [Methylobacterium sp. WCS2018Hpa-22]|uniref:hypothetical protein n=1 Tax=Methylobacterium sp. WCS2018Hpa-22 TaxID=3073633 RepID=UPI00288A1420|nr:hypothetical protein [Methylobacterium sp. WCS2018Hpa-22]